MPWCSARAPALLGAQQAPATDAVRTVLFVCEHGTVKSLLAKVLFERHAAAAWLQVETLSRGRQADSTVPAWMQQRLRAEGVSLGAWRPQSLRAADLATASYVVSFDLAPSATDGARAPRAPWDSLPSFSQDYPAGRAAIERRVRELVDSLSRSGR